MSFPFQIEAMHDLIMLLSTCSHVYQNDKYFKDSRRRCFSDPLSQKLMKKGVCFFWGGSVSFQILQPLPYKQMYLMGERGRNMYFASDCMHYQSPNLNIHMLKESFNSSTL